MAEKQKRTRPTVVQVREMEETIHRQCQELDAWRDKYRALQKEVEKLKRRGLIERILNKGL